MSSKILWGAEAIGRAAGLVDVTGAVSLRRTFYLLEAGLLPARKVGGSWVSNTEVIQRELEANLKTAAEARAQRKRKHAERAKASAEQATTT